MWSTEFPARPIVNVRNTEIGQSFAHTRSSSISKAIKFRLHQILETYWVGGRILRTTPVFFFSHKVLHLSMEFVTSFFILLFTSFHFVVGKSSRNRCCCNWKNGGQDIDRGVDSKLEVTMHILSLGCPSNYTKHNYYQNAIILFDLIKRAASAKMFTPHDTTSVNIVSWCYIWRRIL